MSIKQLKDELEEQGFMVKKINGVYFLKNSIITPNYDNIYAGANETEL